MQLDLENIMLKYVFEYDPQITIRWYNICQMSSSDFAISSALFAQLSALKYLPKFKLQEYCTNVGRIRQRYLSIETSDFYDNAFNLAFCTILLSLQNLATAYLFQGNNESCTVNVFDLDDQLIAETGLSSELLIKSLDTFDNPIIVTPNEVFNTIKKDGIDSYLHSINPV